MNIDEIAPISCNYTQICQTWEDISLCRQHKFLSSNKAKSGKYSLNAWY